MWKCGISHYERFGMQNWWWFWLHMKVCAYVANIRLISEFLADFSSVENINNDLHIWKGTFDKYSLNARRSRMRFTNIQIDLNHFKKRSLVSLSKSKNICFGLRRIFGLWIIINWHISSLEKKKIMATLMHI